MGDLKSQARDPFGWWRGPILSSDQANSDDPEGSEGLEGDREEEVAADLAYDPAFVREQIRRIGACLQRVLRGDYDTVVTTSAYEPVWNGLAAHINVAIQGARSAIQEAEVAHREAAQARDEALAAARSESAFLTNVSHELRTPLSSIRAAAEILRDYPVEGTSIRREFLDIILSESDRLTRLIENVLDLGRIQAGRLHWDFRQHQLAETLAAVVHDCNASTAAAEHGVWVELSADPAIPPMHADGVRLVQLWTNLIGNAIKFSAESDKVWVRASLAGQQITVEIRDRGMGLRPEDQERIFERFRQVGSDTLTDKPEGAGLGLAICREIVSHHGGTITVDSELDVGTTFRVVLPVCGPGELEKLDAILRRTGAAY